MNSCLEEVDVSKWMTTGETTLIQKDLLKENIPNYRLPLL